MKLDDFFRENYKSMVNYCSCFTVCRADAEECVADAIRLHYDEYMSRLNGDAKTTKRWLNRRAILDGRVRYNQYSNPLYKPLPIDHDAAHFDNPEDILDLKQRLPEGHPILIEYQQHDGDKSTKGKNSQRDISKFHRERKKFLTELA